MFSMCTHFLVLSHRRPSCRRCGFGCWPHAVRASLYIVAVWIRQPSVVRNEDTDTTSRVKLAEIVITDDTLGTNGITLTRVAAVEQTRTVHIVDTLPPVTSLYPDGELIQQSDNSQLGVGGGALGLYLDIISSGTDSTNA